MISKAYACHCNKQTISPARQQDRGTIFVCTMQGKGPGGWAVRQLSHRVAGLAPHVQHNSYPAVTRSNRNGRPQHNSPALDRFTHVIISSVLACWLPHVIQYAQFFFLVFLWRSQTGWVRSLNCYTEVDKVLISWLICSNTASREVVGWSNDDGLQKEAMWFGHFVCKTVFHFLGLGDCFGSAHLQVLNKSTDVVFVSTMTQQQAPCTCAFLQRRLREFAWIGIRTYVFICASFPVERWVS
jgi:hypothetical protein